MSVGNRCRALRPPAGSSSALVQPVDVHDQPAIAWEVGSLEGLAIYSITHVFARLLSAELGAVSRTNALFLFRFAPAFLVFAGVFSGVNDLPNWIYLVAIPFLLGYYEGGYWVSFHSFFNKGGKANSSFQRREVVASCVSAGGVVVLDWMHAVHVAGLLGACLAMLASPRSIAL